MRRWMPTFALVLALLGPVRVAADDLAEMNAVSRAWDRYALLSSRDDPAAADLLAASSLRHYGFLRDAALYASPEQLRRLPLVDRVLAYTLRGGLDADALAALDEAAVARRCLREGWCGVAAPEEGATLPQLSHVTLLDGGRAVGELAPPTGSQFQFGPEFAREGGAWKVRTESTVPDESARLQRQIAQTGVPEADLLQQIVAGLLGADPAPALAVLDRPLRDDPAARTRLNETWPRYEQAYRARIEALRRKAEDGDGLAMYGLGALLYSGALPAVAPQDQAGGLAWLERASDAGHAPAAALVLEALSRDQRPPRGQAPSPEFVARLARHARRAAEGGNGPAMAEYGSLLFNGAGGLARDCRQAEEWSARAEDAGVPTARNDRVWFLATCPIAAQRDPHRALALAGHLIANADTLRFAELDTIAAALAANGRYDEAAGYQQRALDALPEEAAALRPRLQRRLQDYRAGRDWVQDYDTYAEPMP